LGACAAAAVAAAAAAAAVAAATAIDWWLQWQQQRSGSRVQAAFVQSRCLSSLRDRQGSPGGQLDEERDEDLAKQLGTCAAEAIVATEGAVALALTVVSEVVQA
jgi:hypothetical protein